MEVMVSIGGRKEPKRKGNKLFQSFHSQKNFSIILIGCDYIYIPHLFCNFNSYYYQFFWVFSLWPGTYALNLQFFRFLWTPVLKVLSIGNRQLWLGMHCHRLLLQWWKIHMDILMVSWQKRGRFYWEVICYTSPFFWQQQEWLLLEASVLLHWDETFSPSRRQDEVTGNTTVRTLLNWRAT